MVCNVIFIFPSSLSFFRYNKQDILCEETRSVPDLFPLADIMRGQDSQPPFVTESPETGHTRKTNMGRIARSIHTAAISSRGDFPRGKSIHLASKRAKFGKR